MACIPIKAADLLKKNKKVLPDRAKDFSNYTFWYYTSIDTAEKILASKQIYISNLSMMNDMVEASLHEKDKDSVHCLCLCNSNTEKIPMWYLYSGIAGNGVALGFTPFKMKKLIKSIEKISTVDGKSVLHKDEDFDLHYGWIYYRKAEKPKEIMYKRKWYALEDPQEFDKENYFIKSYPWEYEKEFRIVIRNKTEEKQERFALDISSVIDDIKIKLAPELNKKEFEKRLPNLNGFMQYLSEKFLHSTLSINMQLFNRNFESFVGYLRNGAQENIDYSDICRAISPAINCQSNKQA